MNARPASAAAGVSFHHVNGASPDKHLIETIGSGGLFFDYDNDGWIDIFLVDGGSLADPALARQARHRLFRNRSNGTFDDVTSSSGIRSVGYGMGACAGELNAFIARRMIWSFFAGRSIAFASSWSVDGARSSTLPC